MKCISVNNHDYATRINPAVTAALNNVIREQYTNDGRAQRKEDTK